jgi:hypothetical protein
MCRWIRDFAPRRIKTGWRVKSRRPRARLNVSKLGVSPLFDHFPKRHRHLFAPFPFPWVTALIPSIDILHTDDHDPDATLANDLGGAPSTDCILCCTGTEIRSGSQHAFAHTVQHWTSRLRFEITNQPEFAHTGYRRFLEWLRPVPFSIQLRHILPTSLRATE